MHVDIILLSFLGGAICLAGALACCRGCCRCFEYTTRVNPYRIMQSSQITRPPTQLPTQIIVKTQKPEVVLLPSGDLQLAYKYQDN